VQKSVFRWKETRKRQKEVVTSTNLYRSNDNDNDNVDNVVAVLRGRASV